MGEITGHIIAYRDGRLSFDALCAFLADFPYQLCPPFGWWQMYASSSALENTVQEMLGTAETLLTDEEYVALIMAFKSRRASVHEPGDDGGCGDGGQPTAV